METLEMNPSNTIATQFQTTVPQVVIPTPNTPRRLVACNDFQGIPQGTHFPPGKVNFGNGLRYTIAYGGGARISEDPNNPAIHLLEGIQDGAIIIDLMPPFKTDLFDLELMQAGNDPIEIRWFSDMGKHLLGTTHTTVKDQMQSFTLTGNNLTTVTLSGPELYLKQICYALLVRP